ncbi:rnhA operon protein [Natrinema versiforme]|uniref:RnhA operon protein n=1 Tax=Natrinema versiforme TaxID=88724 RepID=A0A4P8WH85_9EURY|nr:rnhA operon protein [Natrinema versiforme]QCS42392.1 rnhA operon protein [Natrinema versiforme]
MTDPNAVDADADGGESSDVTRPSDTPEASGSEAADAETDTESADLSRGIVDEVERLTRLERSAVDENEVEAYEDRRDDLLDEHDFTARIRDDDGDDALVLHPAEWHDEENGVIRTERIDDIDRAVEIPLEGTADPDDWEAVDDHNRDLVAAVREAHGDVHGDNAAMLADFAGNHYAKPIESLTSEELAEFGTDYAVRNAWPSAKQQEVIAESIEHVFETAGEPVPEIRF